MIQALYKVIMSGELDEDRDKDTVVRELAALFKCTSDNAAKLVSGKPTPLKKQMNHDTATKYQARLEKVGVKCSIESVATPQQDLAVTSTAAVQIEVLLGKEVEAGNIVCPKCNTEQVKEQQCAKCGVFIEKYLANQLKQSQHQTPIQGTAEEEEIDDMRELALFVGDAFDDNYRHSFQK